MFGFLEPLAAPLIGGVVNSIFGGNSSSPAASGGAVTSNPIGGNSQGANIADPFNSQWAQYQPMLQQLMTQGIGAGNAGYDFALQQGIGAVDASAAAHGTFGSGGEAAALTKYGQGMASQQFQNQFNDLALLSGVNSSQTGTAGQIFAGQQGANNQAVGQVVGAGANALQGLLTGNSSSGAIPGTSNDVMDSIGMAASGQTIPMGTTSLPLGTTAYNPVSSSSNMFSFNDPNLLGNNLFNFSN